MLSCPNCGRPKPDGKPGLCEMCQKVFEKKPCRSCQGTGKLLGSTRATCPTCKGEGKL